jgi:hypothetical protein
LIHIYSSSSNYVWYYQDMHEHDQIKCNENM